MTTQPLLSSLPLFPLGTVLFPGGLLPLRIFEVRYLDMIGKCHKAGSPFGVVSLTQGSEVRRAGAEAESFAALGTLEERRRMEGDESVRLPLAQPYRFDDCGWVANRWCELLPMQPELKQRLLELDSPLLRLELVSDLLARTGIAE